MAGESVAEFEEAAIEHGRFQDERGNPYADRIVAAARSLRDAGVLDELSPLLSHANPNVRIWAASYLLGTEPDRAERVLEEVSTERDDIVGFTAEHTLSQWRAGQLQLP